MLRSKQHNVLFKHDFNTKNNFYSALFFIHLLGRAFKKSEQIIFKKFYSHCMQESLPAKCNMWDLL